MIAIEQDHHVRRARATSLPTFAGLLAEYQ